MIILDTHIWLWWVNESPQLTSFHKLYLEQNLTDGVGISLISCWEVAKLVELGRLELSLPVKQWLTDALAYPNVHLLPLDIDVLVHSTQLPAAFHRDPADQIIVATARVWDIPLLTMDAKLLEYPHVNTPHDRGISSSSITSNAIED